MLVLTVVLYQLENNLRYYSRVKVYSSRSIIRLAAGPQTTSSTTIYQSKYLCSSPAIYLSMRQPDNLSIYLIFQSHRSCFFFFHSPQPQLPSSSVEREVKFRSLDLMNSSRSNRSNNNNNGKIVRGRTSHVEIPSRPENTHHRGKYHCMADLLFDRCSFEQTSTKLMLIQHQQSS